MINTGIVGATGYTGVELMRLLSGHPDVALTVVTSESEQGVAAAAVFPGLRSHVELGFERHDSDRLKACDLVFFATPHATAMHYVSDLLDQGCKIIDLSADFRIKDIELWEQWYGEKHACPGLVDQAVYGLPEINRERIKQACLVANPGCYPTAVTLALLPAVKAGLVDIQNIIVDAKSGVSGAGRRATLATQFSEVAESVKAYNVTGHRHAPEIMQNLNNIHGKQDIELTFVPHLVPMNRGILATIYVKQKDRAFDMQQFYQDFFRQEPFVDVMPYGSHPDTRSVRMTNTCRISLHSTATGSEPTIILSVIDNLVKGAAGQAIQNMNLMFNLDERKGLVNGPGLFP